MKYRMIQEHVLEFFRTSLDLAFSLEAQFSEEPCYTRGHSIDEQDHAPPVGQISPEEFAGVTRLEVVALDAQYVDVLVLRQLRAQVCRLNNSRSPLTAHDLGGKR